MRVVLLAVGVALVTTVSCVSTNAIMLGTPTSYPEVAEEDVVVYLTAEDVPGKYEEIALLNSSGSSGYTSEEGMVNSMRKKAGQLGANAIILDAMSEPSAGSKVAAAVFGTSAERKGKALAIRILPSGWWDWLF